MCDVKFVVVENLHHFLEAIPVLLDLFRQAGNRGLGTFIEHILSLDVFANLGDCDFHHTASLHRLSCQNLLGCKP